MANNSNNRNTKRTRTKDSTKKIKKKVSVLVQERVDYIDYKDVNLLQRFLSDRSKIRARRVSGNDAQQQRDVATAIKNAREMALMPYAKRVTTQRSGRSDRGDRGERGDRGDRGDRGPRPEANEPIEAVPDGDELVVEAVDAVEAEV
jgi:small subunit ribosomal protein S18